MNDERESATREIGPVTATEMAARIAAELTDPMLRGCVMLEHDGRAWPSLGRVALLARIGQGGMGIVYRGLNPRLGTEVAVKVLPPTLDRQQEEFTERFVREARLAGRLRSDHLVSVFDVDRDPSSGCHFLVMELVKGRTAWQWLRDVLDTGRSGARESDALDVAIAATKGLAAAHAEGVVHRDVKPGNVLIPDGPDGGPLLARAKLSDLGLARGEDGEASLTATSIALGTPGYMAPEQAKDSHGAGKPADVFAMGASLYALLTGDAPFRGSTAMDTILRTMNGEFRPLAEVRPDVSAPTAAVVARCLAHDPARRFADGSALLAALEACRGALGAGPEGAHEAMARIDALAAAAPKGLPVKDVPRAAPPRAPAARAVGPHGTVVAAAVPVAAARASRTFTPATEVSLRSRVVRRTMVGATAAIVVAAAAVVAVPRLLREGGTEAARADREVRDSAPQGSAAPAPHDDAVAIADAAGEREPAPPTASHVPGETPPVAPSGDASGAGNDDAADAGGGDDAATAREARAARAREMPERLRGRRAAEDPEGDDGGAAPRRRGPDPQPEEPRGAESSSAGGAGPAAAPPAAPPAAPALPTDPVEAAQEFDLGGLPSNPASYPGPEFRKEAASVRKGDLAAALAFQRKLAQYYYRMADMDRHRVARARGDLLERELAERGATASGGSAPAGSSGSGGGPPSGGGAPPQGGGALPPGAPPPPPPPPPPPGAGGGGPHGPPPGGGPRR